MTADFETRAELRMVARQLLADAAALAPLDWRLLAEVGWLGLEVPERCSGAGASFAEVAVVLQELGRARASSGYLGAVVLAVAGLELLAPFPDHDRLQSAICAGDVRLAVVLPTGDASDPPFQILNGENGIRVVGQAEFVPDAAEADRLLLLAKDPAGEPVLVNAARGSSGLTVTQQPILDQTRSVSAVVASDLKVSETDIRHFGVAPEASASLLRCRGALAVACDSFGVAGAMLESTVAYAKVRHQFGRPIGSFQGVKFSCADMLVALRISEELLSAAVQAMAVADPRQGSDEVEVAVARAKAFVGAHALDVVGKALQLHGGIGYTWESGIHVALKRAAFNRSWFGSPAAHRRRLAHRFIT